MGFTGHIEDADTGLTYMHARYYDPVIGRFLSPDPVGLATGGVDYFNRYAYVANDPVNNVDPDGRAPESVMDRRFVTPRLSSAQRAAVEAQHAQIGETAAQGIAAGAALAVPGPEDAAVGVFLAKGGANLLSKAGNFIKGLFGKGAADTGASSARSGQQLQKQLASESQMAELADGGGTVISQPAKSADRIASQHGIDAQDVQKVTSDAFKASDGTHVETHAFRNAQTNELIEPKTVINP